MGVQCRDAISDYLIGTMRAVKARAVNDPDSAVSAELGKTTLSFSDSDGVLLSQGRQENVTAAVLFEVNAGKIKRYDLCIPELLGVFRSGLYPICWGRN